MSSKSMMVRAVVRGVGLGLMVAGSMLAPLQAGEGLFSRTYTTDTEPEGHWELEQAFRQRSGRSFGSYRAVDSVTELEYGVTNDLQAGLYLRAGYLDAKGSPDGDDAAGVTGFSRKRGYVQSVSAEFIYRFLNPAKDGLGLAVYVEPELAFTDLHDGLAYDGTWGGEYKLLLQKNFSDDRVVLAYNLTLENESIRYGKRTQAGGEAVQTRHGDLDWNNEFGISCRVAPRWNAGWELRNHNEYGDYHEFEHAVWWTGPSLHYASPRWWATLGALYQIHGSPDGVDAEGAYVGDGKFLRSHERWEVTLKFGIPF